MKRGRVAANRIPISEETHEQLRDFKNGLGDAASFDDAILILLKCIVAEDEDPYQAGKRLRGKKPDGND